MLSIAKPGFFSIVYNLLLLLSFGLSWLLFGILFLIGLCMVAAGMYFVNANLLLAGSLALWIGEIPFVDKIKECGVFDRLGKRIGNTWAMGMLSILISTGD